MKSNLFSGHNKLLRAIPLVIIAVALVIARVDGTPSWVQ